MRSASKAIPALLAGAVAASALLLAGAVETPLVIDNVTGSVPKGLYIWRGAEPAADVIVAIRPPPSAQGYLKTLGYPAGALLLKRVAGLEGDLVCSSAGSILVGEVAIPRRERDGGGRALPRWQGCRRLGAHEVLLLGDSPTSFDGRYFGPVGSDAVVGVYMQVP